MILNVLLHKHALIVLVWIHVHWKNVALMHYVQQKITELCAPVHQAIDLIQIHTSDANNMNVSLTPSAQQLLPVKMRSVWILANVQDLLIVHQGTIEAFVPVNQVTPEIHME